MYSTCTNKTDSSFIKLRIIPSFPVPFCEGVRV
uniref:Uncharacterized protein n=1 Tax=Lepeophtheirus salmonis TaxID=72036 RepID=A0A0K2UX85_LEPSM